MHRLYFRIYLAVLASLVLSALLASAGWFAFGRGDTWAPRAEFIEDVAARLLPPASASAAEQEAALLRWSRLSGYEFALFDARYSRIADTSGGAIPAPRIASRAVFAGRGQVGITLQDGRTVVAARPSVERNPLARLGVLGALLGIAVGVGIAAYPVVRRLTRNLEALEHGVAALGAGNLSARVDVNGRDEVARLAATWNRAAERIETLVTAHKSLLANASHELRTPLARLRLGIEQSAPSFPAATRDDLARDIRELDQLIDEILLASRLDAQPDAVLELEPVDLVGLAAEECARAGAELSAPAVPPPLLHLDARLMRRLIRNLLDNAGKYGGAPAEVEVSRTAGGGIVLDVMDRGPGVPEAERERIFEPFHRVPGTRHAESGAGLGLALARTIARRHGATLDYRPRDGGGSIFRLALPPA